MSVKLKLVIFLICLIILILTVVIWRNDRPSDCPNVAQDDLSYPLISTGWILQDHIWWNNENILYLDEKGEIYITSLDGETSNLGYVNSPYDPPYTKLVGWSPENSLLIFANNEQKVLQISNLEKDQEQQIQVTSTDIYHVALSPNDLNVAVVGDGEDQFLWNISSDFDDATKIGRYKRGMLWSPDGKKIAYYIDYGNRGNDDAHLRVQSIITGKTVYSVPEGACQGNYSWSPNSQQIAFDARLEGGSDIYVGTIDGEAVSVNLTNTSMIHEYDPQWNPNHNSIVYMGVNIDEYSGDMQQNLYLLNVATGEIMQLTDSELYETSPIWSPDGRHIAFMSTDLEIWNLEIMNADGNGRRILSSWTNE